MRKGNALRQFDILQTARLDDAQNRCYNYVKLIGVLEINNRCFEILRG